MHYTFTLTQKHTTNTDLVGPDGRTVYRVETPWKLGAKKHAGVGNVPRRIKGSRRDELARAREY